MASWDGPIVNETRDLRIVLSGDLALAYGLERLAGGQGGVSRDIWLRFTLGLARGPQGWRVTHEHSSVPMRKEGGRLIGVTDLTP